jgi:phage anti-repressor protein
MITFAEFLKKYSTIPNQFIDDFFNVLQYTDYNDTFFINFDNVVKWLGQRKDSTKRTLVDNFIKNVDYTLKKNDKFRGKPKNEILLKQSTFKKLCMISKSNRAKEVREYFLNVEETLDKYKDYIINSLKTQVKSMDLSLKPRKKPSKGVIYGFEIKDNNRKFIKIGKSKDLKHRMIQYNSSHADKIDVEFIFETDNFSEVEGCIKEIMKKYQYRKGKEVYEVSIDKLKKLVNGCDKLTKKFYKTMEETTNNVLLVIEKNK